jgi:hypothetical protein
MKTIIITGCVALLLATETAHAECRHDSYFRCGNKLVDVCDFGHHFIFVEVISKEKSIELPTHAFRIGVLQGDLYFRGRKCSCVNALMGDGVQVSTNDECR